MAMNFDFERIWESKRAYRRKLAALPIAEKLAILDAMRDRTLAINKNAAARHASRKQTKPNEETAT